MAIPQIPIFQTITEEEYSEMQGCRLMRQAAYEKQDTVLHAGHMTQEFGIVLSGSVHIENIDLWGNRSILSSVGAGGVFAETYALSGEPLMVDVVAAAPARILFFNLSAAFAPQNRAKSWYQKLSHNLLLASAQKNLALSDRIFCTSSRTIRGRVLTYLSMQAARQGSTAFTIPFNRQQMADYLNVDRSALSGELGEMKKDGLLEFRKNWFELKSPASPSRFAASANSPWLAR